MQVPWPPGKSKLEGSIEKLSLEPMEYESDDVIASDPVSYHITGRARSCSVISPSQLGGKASLTKSQKYPQIVVELWGPMWISVHIIITADL
jgi:hypothetical protein